ncbi:class I SAM-dependent methyltransferase [Pedobacter petrophilus]|uniref:class I SAM-dependent methyltransferase n=1 Tax=Pedobacter petrophilus TaxID=1908241 RepID=UPI0012B07D01|nr:class I SAM-dependent methyltransferase [Pedobacter petrophilus]
MVNNYDKIANQYDFLSRLVFFKSQVQAQTDQLKYISGNSSILIVGGGTGWILEELAKVHPSGLHVVYVEISQKMIALSQTRDFKDNKVEFINLGVEDFETDQLFDVVLTPFLFDNFAEKRAGKVFHFLDNRLRKPGLWLFVDFSLNSKNGKWWKSLLLKSMYAFFKMIGIVETNRLTDIHPWFKKKTYTLVDQQFYYGSFISGTVYKK